MASIIDTTRIVDLPTKASLSEGDVFVVDNENGATSKISAAAVSGSSTSGLVAEGYSDASTYEVGEYCIHVESGIPKLYKCTTAIATAESWTPAHWEGTDAGAEITDLNQNLTEIGHCYDTGWMSVSFNNTASVDVGSLSTLTGGRVTSQNSIKAINIVGNSYIGVMVASDEVYVYYTSLQARTINVQCTIRFWY